MEKIKLRQTFAQELSHTNPTRQTWAQESGDKIQPGTRDLRFILQIIEIRNVSVPKDIAHERGYNLSDVLVLFTAGAPQKSNYPTLLLR